MIMDADLKPCPFCGDTSLETKEHGGKGHYVFCKGCFVEGPNGHSPEAAVKFWNARIIETALRCKVENLEAELMPFAKEANPLDELEAACQDWDLSDGEDCTAVTLSAPRGATREQFRQALEDLMAELEIPDH
jgi:Lar family restriction alleviation protein